MPRLMKFLINILELISFSPLLLATENEIKSIKNSKSRTAHLPRRAVLFTRSITLGTKKLPGKDQKLCLIPRYGH